MIVQEPIPVALPRRLEERRQVLRGPLQLADQLPPKLLHALPYRVLIGALVARNTPRQQGAAVVRVRVVRPPISAPIPSDHRPAAVPRAAA